MFDLLIKSKMGFLQSVKFIKSTKTKITPLNQQVILNYIHEKLIERKVDGVTVADGQIKYQGSTSGWNRAIFSDVDCGKFNLIQKEGKWVIVYVINLKKSLLIVSSIISLVAGIFNAVRSREMVGWPVVFFCGFMGLILLYRLCVMMFWEKI